MRTKRKNRRVCLEVVLIRPAEGRNYAEVVKKIKSKIEQQESSTVIKAIRKKWRSFT